MSGFETSDISGSGPSPDEELDASDPRTVTWETPVKRLAGVRDPGSKAAATGIILLATSICFQFDLAYKQTIIWCATLFSGTVAAYGPYAGKWWLDWRDERIAQREFKKINTMAKAFPNDPDIEEKARIARAILSDGWLNRVRQRTATAPATQKPAKK